MKPRCLALFVLFLATCSSLSGATPRIVMVFPFENLSGDPNLGWMSEGIADFLANRLASPTRYVLEREERDAAYRQLRLSPAAPLTLASEFKVAQTVGVNVAIVGSFTVKDGQLTTTVRWLDVPGLKLSPAEVVSGKLQAFDDLETRAVWKLVSAHDNTLGATTEEEFERRFPPVRLGAFENYIRGVLANDAESRIRFLSEADRLNPDDHRAAFALGRYYFVQKDYANSATWLRKLVSGDGNYPEALFLLGLDEYFAGHDEEAQTAFEQLAKQMPLGEIVNNLGVVKAQRKNYNGALADFDRAYQSDQSDPDFAFNLGVCLWSMQKYDRAAQYLRTVVTEAPDDVDAHQLLAQVLGKLGFTKGREGEMEWLSDHGASPDAGDDSGSAADSAADFNPQLRLKEQYDGRAFRLLALMIQNAAVAKVPQETRK